MCAEILAIKIRGNKNISGIKVTETEHKLSQFADDTSLILDGKEKSLSEALAELIWFAKISGLNINFSKTQVIWFGSKKYSEEIDDDMQLTVCEFIECDKNCENFENVTDEMIMATVAPSTESDTDETESEDSDDGDEEPVLTASEARFRLQSAIRFS